jgi:hypothetical protein
MPKINKPNLSPSSSKPIVKIHICTSFPDFHLSKVYISRQVNLTDICTKHLCNKTIKPIVWKGLRVNT